MNLPSEKEILHALKQREDLHPRSEFVEECEAAIMKSLTKRKRAHIWYLRTAKISCIGVAVMLVVWLGSPLRQQPMEWAQTEPIVKEPLHNEPSISKPPIERKGPTIRPTVQVPTHTPIKVPDRVPAPPLVKDRDQKPAQNPDSASVNEKPVEQVVEKKASPLVEQHQMTKLEQIAYDFLKPRLGDSINDFQGFSSPEKTADSKIVYYRMVHNTPILDQNINLSINVQTEDVSSSIQGNIMEDIDPLRFPLPKDVLPKAKVDELLEKEMHLVYQKIAENQYVLGYQPAIYGYIDAKSGEWLHSFYKQLDKSSGVTIPLASRKHFSAESEEDVHAILVDLFNLDPQTLSVQNGSSYQGKQKYYWKDNTGKLGQIGIDILSGQLVGYSFESESKTNLTFSPINKVEAKQKAIAFLEQIAPAQIQELYLDTNKETIDKNFIILTFYPSKEGIPVISHPYYVTVDMDTGTITNYKGSSFDPASLPAKSNILSIKEATQTYIQSYPFQLAYILSSKNGIPRLVYTVLPDDTEAKTIDAKTGQLLTMENK
ncbi:YcdB/YcdC domain-containing protein [Brevibacillus laterosporus]|uniref:YcdB/YcdC domain-containing protein n=1 Tax=Brevibacillus laterosporus TaxID=1465 RepID=UPI000839C332|nr:YcdB/YcdC domain-containing protein [Brevibacillus laterosporus]